MTRKCNSESACLILIRTVEKRRREERELFLFRGRALKLHLGYQYARGYGRDGHIARLGAAKTVKHSVIVARSDNLVNGNQGGAHYFYIPDGGLFAGHGIDFVYNDGRRPKCLPVLGRKPLAAVRIDEVRVGVRQTELGRVVGARAARPEEPQRGRSARVGHHLDSRERMRLAQRLRERQLRGHDVHDRLPGHP